MGIINIGAPLKEVCYLRETYNYEIFVEGGTYLGQTAKKASKYFKKVYTIEKSQELFERSKEELIGIKNVEQINGDTRDYLDLIIKNNNNIVFWLDAHWSGDITYGINDECPLIMELSIIFSYSKNFIILIDDARLFLAPPPIPHNFQSWPSINEIIQSIPKNWDILIYEDVIYIYPIEINLSFRSYIQKEISEKNMNKKQSKLFSRFLQK